VSETNCGLSLLPPKKGVCQLCAYDHERQDPHNKQSLYYCMRFLMAHGRNPTWADAVAHCTQDVRENWRTVLKKRDKWSQPEGEPIMEIELIRD